MPTAFLLTGRPNLDIDDDGLRILGRPLGVDLGVHLLALGDVPGVAHTITSTQITVPAGFRYDGASLPSAILIRLLMGPKERYEVAGCVHDWLYRVQAPRGPSDEVFRIVACSGSKHVGPKRARAGWLAVRAGGWVAYWKRG